MDSILNGPQLVPPTISLLTAADIVPIDGSRWEAGYDLVQDGPENSDVQVISACPIVPTDTERDTNHQSYTGLDGIACTDEDYTPFIIFVSDTLSTFNSRSQDAIARAERKLLTAEAAVLEAQLWDAVYSTTDPFLSDGAAANNVFATNVVPMTATSAWEALALLENTMSIPSATGGSASRGMIHARPQVIHELLRAQTIRRVGNVYLTPLDNIIVPGRGYPGTGPANQAVAATEWMYGHPGIVQIRRSEIERLSEKDFNANFRRDINDRQAIVQRVVSVALNSALGVFAIEFNAIV